jgi:benzodiazapine receptor
MKGWYSTLRKPPLNPPNWLFPPAWTALYISMGYASHLVARVAMETLHEPTFLLARAALGVYTAQLAVNIAWTPLFFGRRNPALGLVDIGVLGGLVGAMTGMFFGVSERAGWFVAPYLVWIGFATYQNYGISVLNPDEGPKTK